jgi:hypothetical protein
VVNTVPPIPWKALGHEYSSLCHAGMDDGSARFFDPNVSSILSAGRDPTPSAAILESQTVKTTEKGGRGAMMAGSRSRGRKRHIIDLLGMILAVVVHPAHIQDRDGAKQVLTLLRAGFPGCSGSGRMGTMPGSAFPGS